MANEKPLTIVLPWRTFFSSGGITTFTWDLAKALAELGHRVHILGEGQGDEKVEIVRGVVLHSLQYQEAPWTPEAEKRRVPKIPWSWSMTALTECRRVAQTEPIHIVEAPIWDCEGIAFLLDGAWPLVTSLHTTMTSELKMHPGWNADHAWMGEYVNPTIAVERELMLRSDAIRANSAAIVRTIESDYDMVFDREKTRIIHHGLHDIPLRPNAVKNIGVHVFFVGRFDARKGIDVLLRAIPPLLNEFPDLSFTLAGNNTRRGSMVLGEPDDTPYMDAFLTQHANAPWLSRVHFPGEISNKKLMALYAECDIFCSPSRFESFGLVFVEAMRAKKPVIGCNAGGMPEVIADGKNGLLIPAGDIQALEAALRQMIRSPEARHRMGKNGRRMFETCFTAQTMAEKSQELYAIAQHGKCSINK
jgi:glycosyltransferase involved in cell wall biosynthesis